MHTNGQSNIKGFNYDAEIAVVGAGPIGIELAVALQRVGANYIQFDAKQIGHTISWWPRDTHFFSTSERVAIAGVPIQNKHQSRATGEEYLIYLRTIVEMYDLQINNYEKVLSITPEEVGFTLNTETLSEKRSYRVRYVVLAKGDMDNPNLLHIPGEDLPHVTHYFDTPHTYFRKRVLVVGGKNSAVEAALRCWRAGAQVAISYRRAMFSDRVKDHILPDVQAQIRNGNIKFYPETVPVEITKTNVTLQKTENGGPIDEKPIVHSTDFVLLCTGFEADMTLFESAGVTLHGDVLEPKYNPETMETDVPGLFVAGTVAAGMRQRKYRLFIENSHEHVEKIVYTLTGHHPDKLGTIPTRQYDLTLEDIKAN